MNFAKQAVEAKLRVEALEEKLKAEKKKYVEITDALSDYLESTDTLQVAVEVDGRKYTVYRSQALQASVPAAKRPEVVQACYDLGLDDLVETSVSTAKIKSYCREVLNEGRSDHEPYDFNRLAESLRDNVSLFVKKQVVVRKG